MQKKEFTEVELRLAQKVGITPEEAREELKRAAERLKKSTDLDFTKPDNKKSQQTP